MTITWTPPDLAQWETADHVDEEMLQSQILGNLEYLKAMLNIVMSPGTIVLSGRAAPGAGWLPCDGALVSRTTYPDLFSAIGVAFGAGDGSTTFGVPNLQQRFPLGKAASGTGSVLGSTGGSIGHTHTQGATGTDGSHSHTQGATGADGDHKHTQGNTGAVSNHTHNVADTVSGAQVGGLVTAAAGTHDHSFSDTGSDSFSTGSGGSTYIGLGTGAAAAVASAGHTHSGSVSVGVSGSTSDDGSHAHNIANHNHVFDVASGGGGGHSHTTPDTSVSATHTHTNPSSGSSGSHDHSNPATGGGDPPWTAVNYFIRALPV